MATLKKTLIVLNKLQTEGLWQQYAIGGAVAALFYIEPFQTEDLDILILLTPAESASLAPLSRIFEYLRHEGFAESGPFVMIHGVPVQFLIAYSPLVEEAVRQSKEVLYEDVPTRVLLPEHLSAIMVETGRAKDRARFDLMRQQAELDCEKLRLIATQFGLLERMDRWTNE